jgi:hypothetical protein
MPDPITLSPSAVATLRFEIKGWRSKVKGSRLPAYRELAAAGIMEPVPGSDSEFRFTGDGLARREEILREAEDRIERERFEPPDASNLNLSESARELLRLLVLTGDRVGVTPETKPAYLELAAARIMFPVSGFATGPESSFRFTYWGWNRRDQWISDQSVAPPAESP